MNRLDIRYRILPDPLIEQLYVHEDNKQLVYRRGPLVFVFNLHATNSYSDWRIPVPDRTDYQLILNTDSKQFGGHGLANDEQKFVWQDAPASGRRQSVQIYVPSRSAQVLAPAGAAT
jgi:1,4-alpha-glucan branching enzyme